MSDKKVNTICGLCKRVRTAYGKDKDLLVCNKCDGA